MRKLFAALVVAATVAGSAQAQSWSSEFGVQGGYARIKPAGTGANDHIDAFDLPGFSLPLILPSYASLYAIMPWKDKIAIEASASAAQGNFLLGTDVTFLNLGLRADYALSPKFYGAAGGLLHWIETNGQHETQLGVQAAVGYRFGFIAGLRGRIEASAAFLGKAEIASPVNVYAVTFGVSKGIGGGQAAPRRGSGRAWEPMFGLTGGYTRTHAVGSPGYLTGIALPAVGGGLTAFGLPVGSTPTMFVVLPIGQKLAFEPGVDIHRVQSSGTTTFGANLQGRLNYAVSGGWYAAAGGNLIYVKTTGVDAETITGANVAWGYRFPLMGGLGGRMELNYTMMGKNDNVGIPPLNTLGLMFGVTIPLR